MQKHIFIFLGLLIGMYSFGQAQNPTLAERALDYNDGIVNIQNEIGEEVISFMELLNKQKFTDAEAQIDPLVMFIYTKTKEVKAIPDFEGETAFRDAATDLFDFYRQMFDVQYREIIGLVALKNRTPEEERRISEILGDIQRQESKFDYMYRNAQDAFAAKYELELRASPLQQKLDASDSPEEVK